MSIERKSDMKEFILVFGDVTPEQYEPLRVHLQSQGHQVTVEYMDAVGFGSVIDDVIDLVDRVAKGEMSWQDAVAPYEQLVSTDPRLQAIMLTHFVDLYEHYNSGAITAKTALQHAEKLVNVANFLMGDIAAEHHFWSDEFGDAGSNKTIAIIIENDFAFTPGLISRIYSGFARATDDANDNSRGESFKMPEFYRVASAPDSLIYAFGETIPVQW